MMAQGSTQAARFVTLEGGEGVGKSTQVRLLKEKLEHAGKSVVMTREPGGSPGAEEIRRLLVEGEPERWTPLTETLLFLAARADHVARVIRPALERGAWVVCDRFADSTIVYQGVARKLGVETVAAIQNAALGSFKPDLTLVLDLDPEVGLTRAGERKGSDTRFEKFDAAFHRQLRQAFRDLVVAEPSRYVLIDADQSVDAIGARIWEAVQERLLT